MKRFALVVAQALVAVGCGGVEPRGFEPETCVVRSVPSDGNCELWIECSDRTYIADNRQCMVTVWTEDSATSTTTDSDNSVCSFTVAEMIDFCLWPSVLNDSSYGPTD